MTSREQRKNQIRASRQSSLDSPKYGTVTEDSLDDSLNITNNGFKSRSQKPGKHNSYTAGMHASFAQGMSQSMQDNHRSYTAGMGISKSPVSPNRKSIKRLSGWKSPMEVPVTTPSAPKRKVRLSAKEKEMLLGPALGKSPTRKNRQTIGNSQKSPTRKSSKPAAFERKSGPLSPGSQTKRTTLAGQVIKTTPSAPRPKVRLSEMDRSQLLVPGLETKRRPDFRHTILSPPAMERSPLQSSKPKAKRKTVSGVPMTTPSAAKQKVRLSQKDRDALKGPDLSKSPKATRKSKAGASKKSTNSPKVKKKTTGNEKQTKPVASKTSKRSSSMEEKATKGDKLTSSDRTDKLTSSHKSSYMEGAQSKPPSRPKLVDSRKRNHFLGKKKLEMKTAPKSVVIIWILMSLELILDLVTSFIAFTVFIEDPAYCCGESVKQGALPLATTIPFFFLIIAELTFLLRAVTLTLWPKVVTGEADDEEMDGSQRHLYKRVCCCITWNAKYIMWIINFLTIVNPFFSFLIAWTLMYLSSKRESFMVMGLEGATIVLHYLSIWYEGSAKTCCLKCLHALILVPFFGTIIMTVWYLKQEGICYDASIDRFWYKGCEVCEDGVPPVNGTLCPTMFLINGQNVSTYESFFLWELNRTSLCTDEYRFCFYAY